MDKQSIVRAIAKTAEIIGTPLSPDVLAIMASDLVEEAESEQAIGWRWLEFGKSASTSSPLPTSSNGCRWRRETRIQPSARRPSPGLASPVR